MKGHMGLWRRSWRHGGTCRVRQISTESWKDVLGRLGCRHLCRQASSVVHASASRLLSSARNTCAAIASLTRRLLRCRLHVPGPLALSVGHL